MTLRKNKRRKNNDTFNDFLDIILKESGEEDDEHKHNNVKGNRKTRSPKAAASKATLERHKKNGNCDQPESKVKVRVRKVDRIQFKTKDNKKMYMCKKCPLMFETVKELKIHRKEHASKEFIEDHTYSFDKAQEIYICNTCSAEFKDKDEAEKHTRMHKEIFECSLCEDKFQTLFQLGSHLKVTHNADQQFSCPLCPEMKFPKPSLFMKHIDTKHQKRYMYNCKECGKCFHSKTLCRDHMNIHLGIKPFACIVCDARFTYSKSVVTHQLKAHRVEILGKSHSTECSFCRNRFVSIASLERHVQQVHSTPKPPKEKIHLCDICGMGFAKKNKMVVHQRVHTGVKPYPCRFCDKNFSKSGERNCHERIHTGERPYSCEYCGKAFRQSAPFKVHIRTHTGERPYVCEFCTKGFTTNQGLKLHKKKNCASIDFKV